MSAATTLIYCHCGCLLFRGYLPEGMSPVLTHPEYDDTRTGRHCWYREATP